MSSESSNLYKLGFRPEEAAEYLGISKCTLRNIRQADRKALAMGEPVRGPKFITVSRGICLYRRQDLDDWLEKQAQSTLEKLRPKKTPRK